MSSENIIEVKNLSKSYNIFKKPEDRLKQMIYPRFQKFFNLKEEKYFDYFWALRDINFSVKKGESVGIVGKNGSGKSTLLQIICGTLSPSDGFVHVNGRIAAILELGSGFNYEFTGRDNIYLTASLIGLSKKEIDDCLDNIISFADIGKFIDQPIKTYSSGMIVRLAFAIQVQVTPDLLIIDEALAVGDWLFQKRCLSKLKSMTEDGTTLLFVSHDQESLRTLTNKALLLDCGKQVTFDKSSKVLLRYRNILHLEEEKNFHSAVEQIITDQISSKNHQSMNNSFGNENVQILKVNTYNFNNALSKNFYSGDLINIYIHCKAYEDLKNLNVGVRIRNKEGVKIYSWGTLNKDIDLMVKKNANGIFWYRKFKKNQEFTVCLSFRCSLGMNLYEIQSYVSEEKTPDFKHQRILHWVDESAFFSVTVPKNSNFFGGICDLKMDANVVDCTSKN